jgi:DNA-binding transcriptional MerR regulator
MKNKLRIGELAELAGVTPRTIRYYESLGLLGPSERHGGGFRYYTEAELARLHKIDWLKRLGLSLEEIAGVIDCYFADEPAKQRGRRKVLEILHKHLAETDEKIAELQRFRADLQSNIDRIVDLLAEEGTGR